MAFLKKVYGTYNEAFNSQNNNNKTEFDFNAPKYSALSHEIYQEHNGYSNSDYEIGMNNVSCNEPVGKIFFGENNIKRIQRQIKDAIYEKSYHKFIVEEEQDPSDLLIAMRGVYMEQGKYKNELPVKQVKILNKKLIEFIVPDMMTEIKQYYGYLKDVNEPIKPIDRPMNVCNAGRRSLPSVTTTWTR